MTRAHVSRQGLAALPGCIEQHFVFQTTRRRGTAKNRCKIGVITALKNPFLACRLLFAAALTGEQGWREILTGPAKGRNGRKLEMSSRALMQALFSQLGVQRGRAELSCLPSPVA